MEMADGDRFTPEQAEALSALRDGRNVFLSGNAGTGKSYVLNAFISDLKARNVDFLALAPTGIAALNLTDGSTIHRTLKIAPGVCAPDGPKGSRKVLDGVEVAALFPRGHEREEGVAQAVGQADDVHGRLGVGDGCE